jgi:hypothetical protein
MYKISSPLLAFFVICFVHLQAQTNFWNSPQAYLGQKPPSDTPQVFAHDLLIKESGIALDRVAFSQDGKEFYYCHAERWFDSKGSSIKYIAHDGSGWGEPQTLYKEYYGPSFSPDGESLFFINKEKGTVFRSNRTITGWTEPLVFLKRNFGLYNFTLTRSATMYASSNISGGINNYQSYDICVLPQSEKDTTATSLGKPINTPGFDGDFFISTDESFMIISTNETKNFESDLYITYHKKDKTWTSPVGLGILINDGLAHRWGQYVTPDHKYLFYTKGTSEKDCRIYWVRFDKLLQKLKPKGID